MNSGVSFNSGEEEEEVLLIEGDRLAILNMMTVEFLVGRIGVLQNKLTGKISKQAKPETWSKGIMQTAYANGGSTKFIKETLKVSQEYHATGVKHLHQNALKYDIGVYFEANGHGTLTCSEKVKREVSEIIREVSHLSAENEKDKDLQDLLYNLSVLQSFLLLSNDVTGDAIVNFLMVETSLLLLGMSIEDLAQLYEDIPNKTSKCVVAKKHLIKTTYDELDVVAPECLKRELDEYKRTHRENRITVRPSGTEDIVRIYVEAKTNEEVLQRTKEIESLLMRNEIIN